MPVNEVGESLARGVVILRVKHPSTNGGGLKGQQVEFVIGDVDSPGSLFGLLADAVAASF
jgi:hypothetical protein